MLTWHHCLLKKLGVKVKFVVIDWDTKAMELESKNIDVVWNGMTLTDEVTERNGMHQLLTATMHR